MLKSEIQTMGSTKAKTRQNLKTQQMEKESGKKTCSSHYNLLKSNKIFCFKS